MSYDIDDVKYDFGFQENLLNIKNFNIFCERGKKRKHFNSEVFDKMKQEYRFYVVEIKIKKYCVNSEGDKIKYALIDLREDSLINDLIFNEIETANLNGYFQFCYYGKAKRILKKKLLHLKYVNMYYELIFVPVKIENFKKLKKETKKAKDESMFLEKKLFVDTSIHKKSKKLKEFEKWMIRKYAEECANLYKLISEINNT